MPGPDTPLAGRTALVTGGARRLGRAISLGLARAGAHVVVHYRSSSDSAQEVVSSIRGLGVQAWAVQADLSEAGAPEALFSQAVDRAGGVDVLVNNASIFPDDALLDLTMEAIATNARVNAYAPYALARALYAQGREAAVVNLLDARVVDRDDAHAAYHLSKRMLYTFNQVTALAFAPRVRVNGVAPGPILPPPDGDEAVLDRLAQELPLQRRGMPEDVARAVLFLAASPYVTGQVLFVDGGRHLRTRLYG